MPDKTNGVTIKTPGSHTRFQLQRTNSVTIPVHRFIFILLILLSIPSTLTAQTVNIPDPNLRAAIAAELDKASGDPITTSDMAALRSLTARRSNISNLTGLEHAINLTSLDLGFNSISAITSLSGLTKLTWLYLLGNSILNITSLSGLTNLTSLYLGYNLISDISTVSGLTNLRALHLGNNLISDISAVSGLTNLTLLYLGGNFISDISAVSDLTNLRTLGFWNNLVSDISALGGLTRLTSLSLSNNLVSDISAVSGLIKLTQLDLSDNSVSDISALGGLTQLTSLSLNSNFISDISALGGLTQLTSLSLNSNFISDMSALGGLTQLTSLSLNNNFISDISALGGLTRLTSLSLNNNFISDISALVGLIQLTQLYLSDNSISDISALVENTGLGNGDTINLRGNHLNSLSSGTHIPTLQSRGVTVDVLAGGGNVGEPRTVRLVYFLPNDRPYRAEIVERLKEEILDIQTFYGEAMQAHGYRDMTFQIESDEQGEPVVHRVDGQQSEIYYVDDTSSTVRAEIRQVFDVWQNIYFIVIDSDIDRLGTGVGNNRVRANATSIGKNGGDALISTHHFQNRIKLNEPGYHKTSAHEIGHTFGLQHDFRSGGYIMSYGAGTNQAPIDGPDQDRLSKCSADFLSVNPYFNPDIPTESRRSPTIKLTSPRTYPAGSESVDIQVKVTDSEEIHQVILFVKSAGLFGPVGFREVKACRHLMGEKEVVVKFEYDGSVPGSSLTNLSTNTQQDISIAAVDINGDVSNRTFTLSEEPTEQVDSSKVAVTIVEGTQEVRESNRYQTWNLPTGARFRIGKGGPGRGDRAAAFSPNGQYLAVSSSTGIWLYDTVNYREVALLSSQYPITNIAFSPDGNAIVGTSWGGLIQNQVWSIVTKEKIATFSSDGGLSRPVAFTNGKTIASTAGRTIVLWDLVTERELVRMESEYTIDTLSVSHDGTLVAGAGLDGLVKVWQANTGQLIHTFRHHDRVRSIAFSPTENILASGSEDKTIKLWNAITGTEILTIRRTEPISTVAFSPDGKTLAWIEVSPPDTIHLWDVTTQSIIAFYEDPTVFDMNSIAFSPDRKTFVTVDVQYNIVKVWDIDTGNTIDLGHIGLTPISFSPDSAMLATGGTRGVKLWDVNTGRDVATIPVKPSSHVRLVSFSPDGKTLAYRVHGEKFTRLWDVTIQTQTGIIENPSIEYWAFSPDGKILASTAGRIITLWDVVTGQSIATLEGPARRVSHITYSPDGNTLASVSWDRTVRLWDIATNQNIETFEGTSYAAFSPDGTMLVFRKNGGLEVRNLITRDLAIIDGNDFMAFLPDSSMMLLRSSSGESRGSVSVWDAKTSTFITTLDSEIFAGQKRTIFSPDGKTLAITGQDSTILFEPEVIYNQLPLFALSNDNFFWSIPAGISLIHVPLRVTAVGKMEKIIESVGDLYDALGGASVVNFLITYDSQAQEWRSFFVSSDKGTLADVALTDDTGIISSLKARVSVQLSGTPLGIDESSSITLSQGLNLVGLPLRAPRISRVSDLFALNGIGGNVPIIILTDRGEFKAVGLADDPGDVPIRGGQAFILTAQQPATVAISGEAWTNVSGTAAAPQVALTGIEVGNTTPVLGLRGSIVDEGTGLKAEGFRVTVKNLSTGRAVSAVTIPDDVGYRSTIVDIETGRAATVGDVLEISAQSPNPFIGVQSLQYTVTAEDVKQSLIQLPELVAYEIPAETELLRNYPNPFNPETWIPYRLAEDTVVALTIYDLNGQIVRTIDVGHQIAAVYENRSKAIYWDGRNEIGEQVASGVYFYHLSAGDYSTTRKMVILK